jgi:radical SAM superfamily enzyme YgiQ (UPF0313 family)
MKHVIVIPPMDSGCYATREIGDAIYNRPPYHLNPYNAVVYATKLRDEDGQKVEILDAQALGLNYEQTKMQIKKRQPDCVTYFISAYGVPYDVQCVEWRIPKHFVVSPIKTDVNELIEIYSEFPFEKADFLTSPNLFIGKADFSLLDLSKYSCPIRINTNDFCPFQCIFCCRCEMKVNLKPVEDTVEEIKYIQKTYGINKFFLFGSEISINKNFAMQLAEKLAGKNIRFLALDRVNLVEKEVYDALYLAGLSDIHFGVESGSQKMLDYMRKNITPQDTVDAFEIVNKFKDVTKRAYFILGFPPETLPDIFASIRLSWKIAPDEPMVETLYPDVGSPLYKMLKAEGKLKTRRWELFKHYNRRTLVFEHERYKNWKQLNTARWAAMLAMNMRNFKNIKKLGSGAKRRLLRYFSFGD